MIVISLSKLASIFRLILFTGRSADKSSTHLQHVWSANAHGRRPSCQQLNSAGIT